MEEVKCIMSIQTRINKINLVSKSFEYPQPIQTRSPIRRYDFKRAIENGCDRRMSSDQVLA